MVFTQSLNRLGLDQAADERSIKRAYARELKQIDQEADADGFQALRQAYEMALQWVKHKPAAVSFAPASTVPVLPRAVREQETLARPAAPPAPVPARDADTGENPAQLGQAVFQAFLAICAHMAAQGNERDSLLWRKHLQQCASDDRLLNLSARAHFEFLVARLLADGWRSGHEGLFIAARQVFGWEKDRRRLMEFGPPGAWLNQAIDECEQFNHQQSDDCSGQADAVTRVRQDGTPSRQELLSHVPHLRNMLGRFPAWTAVIASRERIAQWSEMELAIPGWRRRLRIIKPAQAAAPGSGSNWWKFVVFIVLLRVVASWFDTPTTSYQPPPWNPSRIEQPSGPLSEKDKLAEAMYERAAGKMYMPPGTRELDPLLKQAAQRPSGRPLSEDERTAISRRINYKLPPGLVGRYSLDVHVVLDTAGAVSALTIRNSSGLPALDKAVEKAIRASAPFSDEVNRQFGLNYWWERLPPKQAARAPAKPSPPAAE